MADFLTTYNKFIKPNEGYFANLTGDSGGMTYGGVARNYHPNWEGWTVVDSYISKKGGLSRMSNNERIPAADPFVTKFFGDMYSGYYFDQIKNQDVANVFFDYFVNSEGNAVKRIQKIVGVSQDGSMGPNTVAAINKMNGPKLNNAIIADRKAYYDSLSSAYPQFYQGWIDRLNKFPTLKTGIAIGGFVLLALIVGVILYISNQK